MSTIDSIINDPRYHEIFSILKGARNGIVYGVKIRFPHAVVMSILFGKGDWTTRAKQIVRMTVQHAWGLAKFVSLYKALLVLQKRMNGGKSRNSDTFFAGLIGGFLVFGERTAINEQIVLYVVSRVVSTILSRDRTSPRAGSSLSAPGVPARPVEPDPRQFSIFAAVAWGAVMWLFNNKGEAIQPGMWNSMNYLYRDSDKWDCLRTLIWHNK